MIRYMAIYNNWANRTKTKRVSAFQSAISFDRTKLIPNKPYALCSLLSDLLQALLLIDVSAWINYVLMQLSFCYT